MFDNSKKYIIAEVGQNHQGNANIAKEYVEVFSDLGADAVKFQMRNNKQLFSTEMYQKSYESENSFGVTYGEHREYLELELAEMEAVRELCAKRKVDFICTPFDEPSLNALLKLEPDAVKIASFDLGNIPFLKQISHFELPIVMSTGGGNLPIIDASIEALGLAHGNLAILHCVSKYPCDAQELLLGRIQILKERYPNHVIGSSDHYNGILSGPLAYVMGARVFEKHVTFNRSQKGTDHSFSLEREGFRKFVRDLERTPLMFGAEFPSDLGKEPVFKKLGKSIIAKVDILKNEEITHEKLTGKILVDTIIPVRDSSKIIGTFAKNDIKMGNPIYMEDVFSS